MKITRKTGEHPYPLVRSGGLFLVVLGVGLIVSIVSGDGSFIRKEIFVGSFLLALASLMFAKPLSYGSPSLVHYLALLFAVVLEVALFLILRTFLPPGLDEGTLWLWGFLIVGIHFLPMAVCFGPKILFLGMACVLNGCLGLLLLDYISFSGFGLVDGALKLSFGLFLLFDRSREGSIHSNSNRLDL